MSAESTISAQSTTAISVTISVLAFVVCCAGGWAIKNYLIKKKKRVLVIDAENQESIEPVCESPFYAVSVRERINRIGRHLPCRDITGDFWKCVSEQQLQQQQPIKNEDIELKDLQKIVPGFEPFEGFDLVEFRKLLARHRRDSFLN